MKTIQWTRSKISVLYIHNWEDYTMKQSMYIDKKSSNNYIVRLKLIKSITWILWLDRFKVHLTKNVCIVLCGCLQVGR